MTMDLKEIIKWFIPCFHILLMRSKMEARFTLVFLILFFNSCPSYGATVNDVGLSEKSFDNAKNVDLLNEIPMFNQSVLREEKFDENDSLGSDSSVGRTFGRPFKKMMAGLMPIIFQVGAASTWAVVAALVGFKTLVVTLIILKLLLVAGAAKFGALFANKGGGHAHHGWEPHQKEIHLHIHNTGHQAPHEIASWSRTEGELEHNRTPVVNVAHEPYSAGPQTISTPFGKYVKVE